MEIKEKTKTITVRYIEYDGIKFYPDQKNYWIGTINKKPVRLHVYVWEKYNGKKPKGYHVHHKDLNPDNNDITNLQLLTQSEHMSLHANLEHNKALARKNLIVHALPKAAEWHKSKECSDWGKENYKVSLAKAHIRKFNKICEVCGKEYIVCGSNKSTGRFCSNKCKSKWRRDNNPDLIETKCVVCGKIFTATKYNTRKTCSQECRSKYFVYRRNGIHWDN